MSSINFSLGALLPLAPFRLAGSRLCWLAVAVDSLGPQIDEIVLAIGRVHRREFDVFEVAASDHPRIFGGIRRALALS